MSYHVYTTPGIILKRTNFGEANILLYILTLDFGLISASARSARLSSSKLKGALGDYTYVSVSCVKGKNGWRLTNVSEKENFYFGYPKYCHKTLSQISSFLLKMIVGEDSHPEIFRLVLSGFEFLKTLPESRMQAFEMLMVLRVLYFLGYVTLDSLSGQFLEEVNEWSDSLLEKISENKKEILEVINRAIKESQL